MNQTEETKIDSTQQSNALRNLILITLGVIGLAFIASKEMDSVREFIAGSGWVGMVISIALYGLLGASPIPSEPLTVLLSTVYGPFTATLVAGTGNMLAALIEYYIGMHLGDVASFEKRRTKLPLGLGRFPVDSPVFLIAARMLPGYGPKFVSVICGVFRVPLWRYIWTAAIPTYLGSAMFAYGGFGLLSLREWFQK